MPSELGYLLLCGLALALWAWAGKGRETVDRISVRICRELNVQRLDGSVALRRLGVHWQRHSVLIRRVYAFEYSTSGSDRRSGQVCLLNALPVWARLDHPDGPIHIEL